MDERNTVNFMRLLSDESTQSTLSSDSQFMQTQILDQLPSVQARRPEHSKQIYLDSAPEDRDTQEYGSKLRSRMFAQPLRNLPLCLQAKRNVRDMRNMQKTTIGFWESWRRSQSLNRRRAWEQLGQAVRGLVPWQRTLHVIEGRFGVGVKAYFVFLRYLVYLNLLHCALIGGLILGPTTFYGQGTSNDSLKFEGNDSVLDFFLGTGYLDRSPVFYGFYSRGSLNFSCLNTPLLYLCAALTIYFISLILIIRRTVRGYKHTWILGKQYNIFVSYKIFCGWDYTIQDPAAAALKQNFIRNDLKLLLDEQSFSLREAQRTFGQRIRLYLLRIFLNLSVLSLLGGAFYLIYFAIEMSQSESHERGHHWLLSLILQYLPPITMTTINMFLPHVFRKISDFEDNSFTAQVNVTLLRSIFLKLASLGIFLFFLFRTSNERCWENQYGREMYKLCIFNFLATCSFAFFINYPRKLLNEKYPSSLVARLFGKQQFLIPFNVLDLVYVQTVSWVGMYYCPLLPLIGTATLIATLYIKKFTLLRCCEAEQRMFRASSSSVLFHFMLLLGLAMAGVTLSVNFLRPIHSPCGPFGNGDSVFNVTGECVRSLPSPAQSTVRYLSSEACALPLLMAQVIVLTFYVSQRTANNKTIESLKYMLVMTNSDKHFLVKQHATLLRSKKKVHSTGQEKDHVPAARFTSSSSYVSCS